jgi:hypothetical protein
MLPLDEDGLSVSCSSHLPQEKHHQYALDRGLGELKHQSGYCSDTTGNRTLALQSVAYHYTK